MRPFQDTITFQIKKKTPPMQNRLKTSSLTFYEDVTKTSNTCTENNNQKKEMKQNKWDKL